MTFDLYSKLTLPAPTSIRLLTIEPGYPEDELYCTLLVVDRLDEAPEFEALSYAWGEDVGTVTITVNSTLTAVTSNLGTALHRLRPLPTADEVEALPHGERIDRGVISVHHGKEERSRNVWKSFASRAEDWTFKERAVRLPLWVDALCINQSDIDERNRQVSMMQDIYAKATTVDIWLGIGLRGDIRIALSITAQCLILLEDEYRQAGPNWKGIEEEPLSVIKNVKRGLPLPLDFWLGLDRFYTQCEYFNRVWIIQEVALSKKATIFTGDFEIAWEAIGTAALWLDKKGYYFYCKSVRQVANLWALHREISQGGTKRPLADLLRQTLSSKASDPRDKIFALLGVAAADQDPELVIDYRKDDIDVFRDAIRYLLKKSQNLEPLSLANNQISLKRRCTWVPKGGDKLPPLFEAAYQKRGPKKVYAASGITTHDMSEQSADLDRLLVRGFIFDTIVFTGDGGMNPIEPQLFDGSHFRQISSHLLRRKKTAYGTSGPRDLMKVLLLTAVAGVNETLGSVSDDQEFLLSGQAFLAACGLEGRSKYSIGPYQRALAPCRQRKFVTTERGYLGLAPDQAQVGDVVAVLNGGELPLILRPTNKAKEFQYVGDAYVHGIMNGEVLWLMAAEDCQAELYTLC